MFQSRRSALPGSAITNMSETTASAVHRAASPIGRAVPTSVAEDSTAQGRPAEPRPSAAGARQMIRKRGTHGMTLIEILVSAAILAVALLAIANMFPTGYTNATEAGRRTMALTAARQILEDMHSIPFANLAALNGFDSTNQATVPAGQPERDVARRWRYTLAGEGIGNFATNTAEETAWTTLTTAVPFNGSVQVNVAPTASPTLLLVVVTVTFEARADTVQVATLITALPQT